MNVLVINCGSSSVKYQVLSGAGDSIASGKVERIGHGKTHAEAITELLKEVSTHEIGAVGHRVVHGGASMHDSIRIDDDVIAAIRKAVPLAPLHNPANLAGIEVAMTALPDVAHVAVFDTAFHARLPRRARTYAINPELGAQYRRFGFHGPSHHYVASLAAEALGEPLENVRLITVHLGNGASVCAIESGHSVETSMGMTPLEGLVMGTRSGDLDPGIVLDLARTKGIDEAERILNRESGLAGLSGAGNDLRDIQEKAEAGDDRARLAIQVFAHRVRKYIGAYAAVLGGVDAVVFTGGIGENSASMRRRIMQRMEYLGLRLDEERNSDAKVSQASPVATLSSENSRVRAFAVATNEERYIADAARYVAGGNTSVESPKPIPIAVSARHIHLTREAMDVLFGPGSELTDYKPLSQPGQFASNERLTIIGPRGRIERVRILGPLRPACQVEISRTDEFKLGVDAPVRHSGKVKGSAPVTLEGPAGTLHLEEGLICAWRHIHMTTADAEAYGVKDKDEVEVAIRGGDRELVFGDVLVRVKDSYALEMHIDTDEANAAELSRGSTGDLIYEGVVGRHALLKRKR
ncbi:MAG: acetate kinase [Polyangiales bacterium]|jgi:acetate kinase